MEQVTHIHLVLNYVHLFSHLSVVHRHKLAETSLRWGTVYHNNMLPALFFPQSRALSLFPLYLSLWSLGSLWWCLPFDVAPLLWRRRGEFSFPAGASDSVCVEESSSWDAGSLQRKLGKEHMQVERGERERFLFQICKCRHRVKLQRGKKRLWNNF